MYCDECGARIPDEAKFCRKCGASLADVNDEGNPTSYVFPATQATDKKNSEAVATFGKVLWVLSGLLTFGFQILWFFAWWGSTGVLVSLFLSPILVFFPVIFLIQEGFTGWFLLFAIIWLVGVVGLLLTRQEEDSDA